MTASVLISFFFIIVDIPEHIKGTYAALCYEPCVKHLKKLGVTAIELEPIHHHVDEKFLLDKVHPFPFSFHCVVFACVCVHVVCLCVCARACVLSLSLVDTCY